jgi:hypothetical protein
VEIKEGKDVDKVMKVEVGGLYKLQDGRKAFCFGFEERVDGFNYYFSIEGELKIVFNFNEDGVSIKGKKLYEAVEMEILKDNPIKEIKITADDVGKRVRLRNGDISRITEFNEDGVSVGKSGTYKVEIECGETFTEFGKYMHDPNDIVEILDDEPEKITDEYFESILVQQKDKEKAMAILGAAGIHLGNIGVIY